MDIAALSISMSRAKVQQELGVSLTKMVLDTAKDQGADLLKMLDVNTEIIQATDPNLGNIIDIKA